VFDTRVTAATFDENAKCWHIETDRGDKVVAKFCIMAVGCLSAPNRPNFRGLEDFKGPVYHTGEWPHQGVDFTGLRVALRLSIPVFVAPAHGKANAELAWQSHWLPNGQLELAATNSGSGHLQITDFEAQFPGSLMPLRGITSKYVLPGSRMSWTLTPPADAKRQGAIPIRGHSDQGDFSVDVAPSDL